MVRKHKAVIFFTGFLTLIAVSGCGVQEGSSLAETTMGEDPGEKESVTVVSTEETAEESTSAIVQDTEETVYGTDESVSPSFGMYFYSNMMEYLPESDTWGLMYDGTFHVREGENFGQAIAEYEADPTLNWDEIVLRMYLIIDGKMIPFALKDTGEEALWQDVKIKKNEELAQPLTFDSQYFPSRQGHLALIYVFNPDAIPEKGAMQSYPACMAKMFKYDNPNGGEAEAETLSDGEYIKIPEGREGDAYGLQVYHALDEKYFQMTFNFGENDIVASEEELYLQVNLGQQKEGEYYVGLLCDGKFLKLNGEQEMLLIKMDKGKQTYQYQIPRELYPEAGLHSCQVVVIPKYGTDVFSRDVSYRYRLLIPE